jgi:hypothetical protein
MVPAPLSQAVNNPPYPTTPTSDHPPGLSSASDWEEVYSPNLAQSPAFNLRTLDEAKKAKEDGDDDSDFSDSDWGRSDDDASPEDLPNPLKIGGGKPIPTPANKNVLPDALRAGPPAGIPIKKSLEPIVPEHTGASNSSYGAISNDSGGSSLKTNNPYLRMQPTGQSNFGGESSQQAWGDVPSQAQVPTYGQLAELPAYQTPTTPTNPLANLNLNSNEPLQQRSQSLDQPPLIAVDPASPQSARHREDSTASTAFEPGMDISSLDAFSRSYGLPEDSQPEAPRQSWQEQQAWESAERERKQHELAVAHEAAVKAEQERGHAEEFHRQEEVTKGAAAAAPAPLPASNPFSEEQAPSLPPRRAQEEELPPPMPPRPINTGVGSSMGTGPESPNTAMNRQRKEHYQIKHIRWHDVNTRGVRTSPILTQNLNGPCPLLALVNALVLSTPPGIETALVETLRTREQVSLGLLLDAVFDELMSGRRGGAAQELPDVSELYKFLLTLHTGLNVNPMFVKDSGSTDGTVSLSPSLAGGFEDTKDMRLYRTFNIPLMHGWLPEAGSEAYIAFDRVAKTYETSQYVQFQEEELDAKLQAGDALNDDEQQMFTDIHAIKEFLNRWPTQLTDFGLKTMRESLQPGQVGILFRNDHFTTLYKDPRTNNLLMLVTDQGYSSHDEIVWESLVDVNGQGSELFSGDFRPVGNTALPRQQHQPPVQSMLDVGDNSQGWTTVHTRRPNQPHSSVNVASADSANLSSPGSTEQEDHDLALALQLQEEEDDRHRRSVEERRRQENQLSEEAIASHANVRPGNRRISRPGEQPPIIPPRRNNVQTNRPENGNEAAPPPTYEEAATHPPYQPPQGHPAAPGAPFGSAYQSTAQAMPMGPGMGGRRVSGRPVSGQLPGRPGRRQSAGMAGSNEQERDKCVVM